MKRVQFSIGQGFDASGRKLSDLDSRKDTAYRYIATTFGGFSASPNDGGWIDDTGRLVIEPDLTITTVIESSKLPAVDRAAGYLAEVFSQASVLITIDNVRARFTSRTERG